MVPQSMSEPEFRKDDTHLDLSRLLEDHILAGFPADLALDLVLNDVVVRAARATRASAAALALARDGELVCRAATGPLAPALGVPLNTRDGLSGACVQTRQPQLSVDTEYDPRIDPVISRRLGIRSILIVPVFDGHDANPQFAGVLEVFSPSPAAFSDFHQKLLEGFAEECAYVRRASIALSQRHPAVALAAVESAAPEVIPPVVVPQEVAASPVPARRLPYERWTLVLGMMAIVATIVVSFLIGSRIGWLRRTASPTPIAPPVRIGAKATEQIPSADAPRTPAPRNPTAAPGKSAAATDELVVYEKGKVIFRMKPASPKPDSEAIVEASSTTKLAATKSGMATSGMATSAQQSVWLAPTQAETRLLSRTEPQYPPEALTAHRAGNVVLEVQVAEDGSVSSVRTISGDPILAAAAAEAVRNWRYQPYRLHGRPTQFQTEVTLAFALPN